MKYYLLDTWQNATITHADTFENTNATCIWFNECNKKVTNEDNRYKVVTEFIKNPNL